MKKRFLTLVMCGMLCISVVACGSDKGKETIENVNEEVTESTEETEAESVEEEETESVDDSVEEDADATEDENENWFETNPYTSQDWDSILAKYGEDNFEITWYGEDWKDIKQTYTLRTFETKWNDDAHTSSDYTQVYAMTSYFHTPQLDLSMEELVNVPSNAWVLADKFNDAYNIVEAQVEGSVYLVDITDWSNAKDNYKVNPDGTRRWYLFKFTDDEGKLSVWLEIDTDISDPDNVLQYMVHASNNDNSGDHCGLEGVYLVTNDGERIGFSYLCCSDPNFTYDGH